MIFATTMVSMSSRQVRSGRRILRLACTPSLPQKRWQSSIGCGALQEATMTNGDLFLAKIDQDDRVLNDLAYSLAMASASDSKVFPLGHRPNRRQQRQLWLSKTKPLLGEVWIDKGSCCPASFSEEEERA